MKKKSLIFSSFLIFNLLILYIYIYIYIYIYCIYISAVKRLIAINRIQNKSFYLCNIQYVCVLCIFIMYTYTVYI